MIRVDTVGIGGIAHDARRLCWRDACGFCWVVVDVLVRVSQAREVVSGIHTITRDEAVFRVEAEALSDSVVNLPGNLRLIELLEDIRYVELREVVVVSRVFYQALRCAPCESRDAVGDALAGNGREPAIRDRELRCHE